MKKKKLRETPFEYLLRKESGEPFSDETVRNWYIARAYVLDKLNTTDLTPDAKSHLHVEIVGDSPIMLAVLRQAALSAHYPNYIEYDKFNHLVCENRTVVTLISDKKADVIISELEREECLCNLLKYCKYTVFGVVNNEDSFIDVEIEITHEPSRETGILFSEDDVNHFLEETAEEDIYKIDTRKAVMANMAYSLGTVIDNLPYEDINCATRYKRALDTFQLKLLQNKKVAPLITSDWNYSQITVKNGLSNIFCADCFEFRELSIKKWYPKYEHMHNDARSKIWQKDNYALSLSEHSRWVVEKLILGFRPLNKQERYAYESLFGKRRAAYSKLLKNNALSPSHIDLCSYRDLRRIDPDNMKYDGFLMLAIPLILEKIRKDDKR